jgi:hypothetical protein
MGVRGAMKKSTQKLVKTGVIGAGIYFIAIPTLLLTGFALVGMSMYRQFQEDKAFRL